MLIAEDLLVLIADPSTGRLRGDTGSVDYGLAAAVLCDLELLGRIHLERPGQGWRGSQVVVDDFAATGDGFLDAALRALTPRDRTPLRAVRVLRKGLRRKLVHRLVTDGVLRRDRRRLFGLIPVTSHPMADLGAEATARAAVTQAFVVGDGRDERTAALIACLGVVGRLRHVVPEVHPMLTKRDIRRRGRAYLDASWPASAARRAYQSDTSAAAG